MIVRESASKIIIMFKQILVVLGCVCLVASATTIRDEEETPEVQESQGGLFEKFNGHVKQLIKTTGKSAKQGYEDAKPVVNDIKGDFVEVGQTIVSHPTVVKGRDYVKPHYETIRGKTAELITSGGKRVAELRARFEPGYANKNKAEPTPVELKNLKPEQVVDEPASVVDEPASVVDEPAAVVEQVEKEVSPVEEPEVEVHEKHEA